MTFRQQYKSARRKQYVYACLTGMTLIAIAPLCGYFQQAWLFVISSAVGVYCVCKAFIFSDKASKAKDYIVFDNFLDNIKQ